MILNRMSLLMVATAMLANPAAAQEAEAPTPTNDESTPELAVQRSIAAEDAAFQAIDEGRWCDAANYFFLADELAPSAKLARNAAEAAAKAGDLRLAVSFYDGLITRLPSEEQASSITRRDALAKELAEQPTSHCALKTTEALTEELFAAKPTEREPADIAPVPEPAPLPAAPEAPPPPTDAAAASETPAPETPETERQSSSGPTRVTKDRGLAPVIALGSAGAGALLIAGGLGAAVVGLQPFLEHAEARRALEEAEASRTIPDPTLQQTQIKSREAYESWGQLTVLAGVGAVVLGSAVTTGASVAYVFLSGMLDGGEPERGAAE